MVRLIAILGAVLMLGACQLTTAEGGDDAVSIAATTGANGGRSPLLVQQECEAAGGTLVYGLAGPQCAQKQPDAGKSCSDSDQCAGLCLAETRTCSPVTPFFGCHEILQGGQTVGLCID